MKKKKSAKKIILVVLLCFISALMVAGTAVVIASLVGDGCDIPIQTPDNSSTTNENSNESWTDWF